VLFDGQPLADVVTSASGDTLTSTVPDVFTEHPGQHVIEVARQEKSLFHTRFEVKARAACQAD
jgi:hypothetical protein